MYVCVCVCVCIYIYIMLQGLVLPGPSRADDMPPLASSSGLYLLLSYY